MGWRNERYWDTSSIGNSGGLRKRQCSRNPRNLGAESLNGKYSGYLRRSRKVNDGVYCSRSECCAVSSDCNG